MRWLWCSFLSISLLILVPPGARADCALSVAADAQAIESQATFSDEYRSIHALATGAGVKVAVIDTGISEHPRLPMLYDGGDLVPQAPGHALSDCDGHGTVVASVLAAQDTGDGIVGIAPDVELVSIRQTSQNLSRSQTEQRGTIATLSAAIHRAIDLHVKVINISLVACIQPDLAIELSELHEALARAEAENIVIVAAAGNKSGNCNTGMRVLPADFPTVIPVFAVDHNLATSEYSLPPSQHQVRISTSGTVAAAISFDSDGLASGIQTQQQSVHFHGTSFAAPLVSGTAALLWQRYPQSSAAEIRAYLSSASDPSTGVLDPVLALTTPTSSIFPHQAILGTPQKSQSPTGERPWLFPLLVFICGILLGGFHLLQHLYCARRTQRKAVSPPEGDAA